MEAKSAVVILNSPFGYYYWSAVTPRVTVKRLAGGPYSIIRRSDHSFTINAGLIIFLISIE
jgi:hypothetical protein